MQDFYISFGQIHAHSVNGKTFDKDCIAVLKANDYHEAHKQAMEIFNGKFCFVYEQIPDMKFFPRGLMNIEGQD